MTEYIEVRPIKPWSPCSGEKLNCAWFSVRPETDKCERCGLTKEEDEARRKELLKELSALLHRPRKRKGHGKVSKWRKP